MKLSIRTKFTLGMIFLFVIILVLSVASSVYITSLSGKTSAILKENYKSLVYARSMSEGIMSINQEITSSLLKNEEADITFVENQLSVVEKAIIDEKNNITEHGEDVLVSNIESDFYEFRDSVLVYIKSTHAVSNVLFLQMKSGVLYRQLALLAQMNGNAIEAKTDDAKATAKKASTRMTILGTGSFLIAASFIFSFATYFNERFLQLFNGIKEIVSSNYSKRLLFEGHDEFHEISLVFNEMAETLNSNKEKLSVTLPEDIGKETIAKNIQELKKALQQMKLVEERTTELISRLEKQ